MNLENPSSKPKCTQNPPSFFFFFFFFFLNIWMGYSLGGSAQFIGSVCFRVGPYFLDRATVLGWPKRVSPLNDPIFFFFFFLKFWIGHGLKINPCPKAQPVTRFHMGLKPYPKPKTLDPISCIPNLKPPPPPCLPPPTFMRRPLGPPLNGQIAQHGADQQPKAACRAAVPSSPKAARIGLLLLSIAGGPYGPPLTVCGKKRRSSSKSCRRRRFPHAAATKGRRPASHGDPVQGRRSPKLQAARDKIPEYEQIKIIHIQAF
jgi:hypothetical protein